MMAAPPVGLNADAKNRGTCRQANGPSNTEFFNKIGEKQTSQAFLGNVRFRQSPRHGLRAGRVA